MTGWSNEVTVAPHGQVFEKAYFSFGRAKSTVNESGKWCCQSAVMPLLCRRREKRLSLWQRVKHRVFLCEHLTSILLPAGFRRHMTHHMTNRRWCRPPAPQKMSVSTKPMLPSNAFMPLCWMFFSSSVLCLLIGSLLWGRAHHTLPGFRETQGSPIKVTDAVSGAGTKWRGQSTLRSSKRHSAQRSKVTVWHPGGFLCYSGSSSMGSSSGLWSMALVLATDSEAMALTASASSESPRLASSRDRPSRGE